MTEGVRPQYLNLKKIGEITSLLSATLLLFLVIDPIGNVPLFLRALKNVEPREHRKIIIRELSITTIAVEMFIKRIRQSIFQ